ncbi:TetR/AcrR family transcriptional regulator [Actinokineospora sp. NPDC004072]
MARDSGSGGGLRRLVEDSILDRAAGLFARHGFEQTSVKVVADAVGLSKAGLLHHFPTKEALYNAALRVGDAQGEWVVEQVAGLPVGGVRDRRAVELLTDIALERPGLVALAFRSVVGAGEEVGRHDLFVSEVFGVEPGDTERVVRVIGALSALAVLSLAANERGEKTAWRPLIIGTCLDALGSRDDRVKG